MGVISQTWNDPPHLCGGGIKLQIGRKPTSRSCRDSEHPSAFDANYMNAAASQRKKISRYRARSRASASSAPPAIRPQNAAPMPRKDMPDAVVTTVTTAEIGRAAGRERGWQYV